MRVFKPLIQTTKSKRFTHIQNRRYELAAIEFNNVSFEPH